MSTPPAKGSKLGVAQIAAIVVACVSATAAWYGGVLANGPRARSQTSVVASDATEIVPSTPRDRFPSVPFWTLGINNLLAREYVFQETPALTEEVAIAYTKRTLEAAGHDTSRLAPFEYRFKFSDGETERLFSRNSLDPNQGRVLWGLSPGGPLVDGVPWDFAVNIWKEDDGIHCLIYLPK